MDLFPLEENKNKGLEIIKNIWFTIFRNAKSLQMQILSMMRNYSENINLTAQTLWTLNPHLITKWHLYQIGWK